MNQIWFNSVAARTRIARLRRRMTRTGRPSVHNGKLECPRTRKTEIACGRHLSDNAVQVSAWTKQGGARDIQTSQLKARNSRDDAAEGMKQKIGRMHAAGSRAKRQKRAGSWCH